MVNYNAACVQTVENRFDERIFKYRQGIVVWLPFDEPAERETFTSNSYFMRFPKLEI